MKTLTRAIHIVVVLMLAVSFVSAGTLNLTFNNASGATYPGTSDLTFPYNFTISGYSGQQLMCMDFANNISDGQSWSATYAVIGTSSPLIDQQSAWLFLQGILGNATMVDANGAVWYLNDGGTAPPLTPGSQNLISSLPTSFTAADLLGPVIEIHAGKLESG